MATITEVSSTTGPNGAVTLRSPDSRPAVVCRIVSPAEHPCVRVSMAYERGPDLDPAIVVHEIQRPGPDVEVSFPTDAVGLSCTFELAPNAEGAVADGVPVVVAWRT
jgi:hypothetical protein